MAKKMYKIVNKNWFWIVVGIIGMFAIIFGLTYKPQVEKQEVTNGTEETNRVYLYTESGPCQGSNMKCKTSVSHYAKGEYVNCSLTPSKAFPNESISGRIYDVDYEIDKSLFLKIAEESNYPIVCGTKRITNYPSDRVINEGDYCEKETKINEFDSWNSNYEAYCCFENYCASWGDVYTVCDCDNSLNYNGNLTEVTCDTPEGEEFKC